MGRVGAGARHNLAAICVGDIADVGFERPPLWITTYARVGRRRPGCGQVAGACSLARILCFVGEGIAICGCPSIRSCWFRGVVMGCCQGGSDSTTGSSCGLRWGTGPLTFGSSPCEGERGMFGTSPWKRGGTGKRRRRARPISVAPGRAKGFSGSRGRTGRRLGRVRPG